MLSLRLDIDLLSSAERGLFTLLIIHVCFSVLIFQNSQWLAQLVTVLCWHCGSQWSPTWHQRGSSLHCSKPSVFLWFSPFSHILGVAVPGALLLLSLSEFLRPPNPRTHLHLSGRHGHFAKFMVSFCLGGSDLEADSSKDCECTLLSNIHIPLLLLISNGYKIQWICTPGPLLPPPHLCWPELHP